MKLPLSRTLRRALTRSDHHRATFPMPRPSLNDIGLKTGTDKANTVHDYLGVYEAQLRHLRDRRFKLIEIGVHKGASINMWAEYFPRARIVGVDIKKDCKRFETDRISIRIGNQGNDALLQRLATNHKPLVVIDDGSHNWHHQIQTFRALWPAVRPGGFFIVEDIHTSFGADYNKTYGNPDGPTAFEYLAKIAEGVVAGTGRAAPPADDFEAHCRESIESVVMLPHSVIVRKKGDASQGMFKLASVAEVAGNPVTRSLGAPYRRIPAKAVDGATDVQQALDRMVADDPVEFDPARSAELTDVTVHGFGPVTTQQGLILAETLNCAWGVRRTSGLYRPFDETLWVTEPGAAEPVPAREDGRPWVLLKHTWSRNYGHWLIDSLPRLGLLDDLYDRAECQFVVDVQPNEQMRSVVVDSLALAGVANDQISFMETNRLRFDRLVVLGTTSRHPIRKSPHSISFLERLADQVDPGEHGRIFVSRNHGSRRRLANEGALLETLPDYHVIHPEQMSLTEQIAAFKGATHVTGTMGAALSNLAFSPRGVRVLALATETMKHDFFYDIVCHKEGAYRGLQGHAVSTTTADIGSDFEVSAERLRDCVEWLESTTTN